ncbi:hypothetical protein [Prolixibacter sp. SD074]|nr:hypothetical protein [Prolixibacter sp. SD074]
MFLICKLIILSVLKLLFLWEGEDIKKYFIIYYLDGLDVVIQLLKNS